MKLSQVLIHVVIVVGALVVYDLLRGGEPRTDSDAPPSAALDVSATDATGEPVLLEGTAHEIVIARNARRLSALEGQLAALQRADGGRPARGSAGGGRGSAEVVRMPALDPSDIVDARTPVYHEDTLRTFEAYIGEMNRRKVERRTRAQFAGTLGHLKLEATESKQEAVVAESLAFGERARALSKRAWSEGERGRDERRAALAELQREYTSVIQGMLSAADARKVLNSRIPRSMGFRTGVREPSPNRRER